MTERYYVVTELRSWDITDEGKPLRDTDIVDRLNEQDEDIDRLKAQVVLYHSALEKIRDTAKSWEGRKETPYWNLGDIAAAAIIKSAKARADPT